MSPAIETLPCFGKINLFLEVQDRRADGYHNLGTLFQTINCCDRLSAEPWDSLVLSCPDGITSDPEQNLVLKAARMVKAAYAHRIEERAGGAPGGIRFTLEKHLPMGAGLGGGSSNAAAALVLCDRLWNLSLPPAEMHSLATRLGSDVPFFLLGDTAFGEGRGEDLKPAPNPYPFHVVVGTPHCHVETAWAYGNLDPERKRQWARFKALFFTFFEDADFYRILHNDFEAPIGRHYPQIRELAEKMSVHRPVKTMLTGSGASVFSLFTDKAPAQECLEAIQGLCRFSVMTEFTP